MRILHIPAVLAGALFGATAHAQLALPTAPDKGEGIDAYLSKTMKGGKGAKGSPASRVDALKAQLAAIEELRKWASTNRYDLQQIYSDSLANLQQARTAIYRSKGQAAPAYTAPTGFEVETARPDNGSTYPTSSAYTVAVVNPDDFYIHVQAYFPEEWVKEARNIRIAWYLFDERYLPMASPYQNLTKAMYVDDSYSAPAAYRSTRYSHHVQGFGLAPGRYFIAAVFSSYDKAYSRETQVSLGVMRVKDPPLPSVKVQLPHYRNWYRTYSSEIELTDAKATVAKGGVIQLTGAFTRKNFAKDVAPAYVDVVAESSYTKKALLRERLPIKSATTKLKLAIKGHGLPAGSYTLRLNVCTEHMAGTTYKYLTGSRGEKLLQVTIP
ncbi:MAG: hypothetical protein IT371_28915 [Deltaproteobacteria bacterium]|nr:hypothetical protein [Deltaproteobacteria bacterium]